MKPGLTDVEFTKIYLDAYKDLCLLALRHVHSVAVAEDIVQDAFFRVLVRRPEVFSFEDRSRTRAYIWRVVRNRAIDWNRKHGGKTASLEERLLDTELSTLVDSMFSPEYGTLDYDTMSNTLGETLSNLSPRAQEVFKLRRDEGLSNKDVAQKLGVTVKAVEKQMTIALKRIKAAFAAKGISFIGVLLLLLQ
ncbi:MAG: sigma-70 family RNA polymerase sigma factor [Bacteroidales bacterium]|nr:sigma-70 family RNA polymerase sigma factor [Bacteroidales bacterium]